MNSLLSYLFHFDFSSLYDVSTHGLHYRLSFVSALCFHPYKEHIVSDIQVSKKLEDQILTVMNTMIERKLVISSRNLTTIQSLVNKVFKTTELSIHGIEKITSFTYWATIKKVLI